MQKYATNTSPAASPTTPHASLSTANPNDDGQSNAEPTSTGGYARQTITWATPTQPSNDASCIAQNSAAISWTSSAAYSTGATNLTHVGVWSSLTLTTEAAYLGRAQIAVAQAVNAAGITLTIAINGLQMGFISA
jgi:hypothetical protein